MCNSIAEIYRHSYLYASSLRPLPNILMILCRVVGFDTLPYWLDRPADMAHENIEVNLTDANGRTTLISAVDVDIVPMFGDIERHTKAIQLLLTEDGTDVTRNAKDRYGRTGLSYASEYGYIDVVLVKLLIECGDTNVNLMNKTDKTPLILCEREGTNGDYCAVRRKAEIVHSTSSPASITECKPNVPNGRG
jgi:ankyrin repeat protein